MIPPGALSFAKSLARAAGEIQRHSFRKKLRVGFKAARNLVTNVDMQCERYIIAAIQKKYPGHGFFAEEGSRCSAEYTWVIDPLDGTTNFSRGLPCFCVSIALVHYGKPVLGVIYEPLLDQLFYSQKGKGAYLNNKRLHVSSTSGLKNAVITTGFPYKMKEQNRRMFAAFKRILNSTLALRRPGAAALDLAYVAAGITDAHYEFRLQPWDVAAGILLVMEAGGKVLLPKNDIFQTPAGLMAASNGKIHWALLKKIVK